MALLVLSDIHFGPSSMHSDFCVQGSPLTIPEQSAASTIDSLVSTCLAHAGFSINGILVAGDLTSGASPSEFTQCSRAIARIADELEVRDENVVIALGNHDVNWRVSSLREGEGATRDELYSELAAHSATPFVSLTHNGASGPVPACGISVVGDIGVVVLNSGFFCVDSEANEHGKLGPTQADWLKKVVTTLDNSMMWTVILLHHHLQNLPYPKPTPDVSMLEEAPEMLALLGGIGVDLVVHGHRHHPILHTHMSTGWTHPVTFLCAGSMAIGPAGRQNGQIPNTFHVVDLEERAPSGAAIGSVFTFEYNLTEWIPAYSMNVSMDARQRIGSIADGAVRAKYVDAAIDTATAAGGQMPSLDTLPLDLQCGRVSDLNLLLRERAEARGLACHGEYPRPNEPFLKPKP